MSTTCMYIITVFTCYALLTALILNCIDWDFFYSMVETFESIFNNLDFTTTGITTSSPSVAYIGREVSDYSFACTQ